MSQSWLLAGYESFMVARNSIYDLPYLTLTNIINATR